jgi:DNA segregation ATPase FtsK/SpoIIIE-like protein
VIAVAMILAYGVHYPADLGLNQDRRTLLFAFVLFAFLCIFYRYPIQGGNTEDALQPDLALPPNFVPPVAPPPAFVDLARKAMQGKPIQAPTAQPVAAPKPSAAINAYAKPKVKPGSFEWFVFEEIETINQMLTAHKIEARVPYLPNQRIPKPYMVAPTSFLAYRFDLKPGQKMDRIVGLADELAEAITDRRQRIIKGYREKVDVRFRSRPFALEVPHPDPVMLDWQSADLNLSAYQALVGVSYDFAGEQPVTINLPTDHHVLIAGMSGFGKSTMMRWAISTLAYNNSPDKIKFLLVDLKNKDLKVFRSLPHVLGYAGDREGASAMIQRAFAMVEQRKDMDQYPYRVVLCIDELAQIGDEDQDTLADVMQLGRAMEVNVICGTQSPTGEEIGTEVNKAFTTRFVSRSANPNASFVYTTIKGMGAEKIAKPGDFLSIRGGGQVDRLKAYHFEFEDSQAFVQKIVAKWGKAKPRADQWQPDHKQESSIDEQYVFEGDDADLVEPEQAFPIGTARPLTDSEKAMVRAMANMDQFQYRGELSTSRLTTYVYGSRDPRRDNWVKEALQEEDQHAEADRV